MQAFFCFLGHLHGLRTAVLATRAVWEHLKAKSVFHAGGISDEVLSDIAGRIPGHGWALYGVSCAGLEAVSVICKDPRELSEVDFLGNEVYVRQGSISRSANPRFLVNQGEDSNRSKTVKQRQPPAGRDHARTNSPIATLADPSKLSTIFTFNKTLG